MKDNKRVEFIKWCCQYADEFRYEYEPDDKEHLIWFEPVNSLWGLDWAINEIVWFYPLLLQRAIEGVNKADNCRWQISMINGCFYVSLKDMIHASPMTHFRLSEYTPDQAKEAAPMWIKENKDK